MHHKTKGPQKKKKKRTKGPKKKRETINKQRLVHPSNSSNLETNVWMYSFQSSPEGSVLCMFEGIRMLKPSAAVDMIMPGI